MSAIGIARIEVARITEFYCNTKNCTRWPTLRSDSFVLLYIDTLYVYVYIYIYMYVCVYMYVYKYVHDVMTRSLSNISRFIESIWNLNT